MVACPCCGFLTLDEEPPGTFEICPVCAWEDDPAQFRDPSLRSGANSVSLTEARNNFRMIGVSEGTLIHLVRPPVDSEHPPDTTH